MEWRDIVALSLAFAFWQWRRQVSATQAQETLRERLSCLRAADDFRSLASPTGILAMKLTAREWVQVAELAGSVNNILARAHGSWAGLLLPLEKDKLEAARQQMVALLNRLPLQGQQEPNGEATSRMIAAAYLTNAIAAEIEGRLRTEADRR